MTKVDPFNCTNFHRTNAELEAFVLFCVFVAGKRADQTASKLNKTLEYYNNIEDFNNKSPFDIINTLINRNKIDEFLEYGKFGRYSVLRQTLQKITTINLETCTVHDLESIPGIGPKTARYFLLHTRSNQNIAVLDTHVLRFMREELGINTPKSTPSNRSIYLKLEKQFIDFAKTKEQSIADLDLYIWKKYTKSKGGD